MAKKKAKWAPRASPTQSYAIRRPSYPSISRGMPAMGRHHFSLRDEARSTGQHTDAFLPSKKLRGLPVAFLSAGLLQGTIPEKDNGQVNAATALRSKEPSSPLNTNGMASLRIRSPSPVSSIGSEEEIVVFRGRGFANNSAQKSPSKENADQEGPKMPAPSNHSAMTKSTQPTTYSVDHSESETQITVTKATKIRHVRQHVRNKTPTLASEVSDSLSGTDSVVPDVFEKRLGGKTQWEVNATPWESRSKPGIGWLPPEDDIYFPQEDTAALDDYMNNIRDNASGSEQQGPSREAFVQGDLDLRSENGLFPDGDDDSLYIRPSKSDQDDWDSNNIADLDILSTSSDVIDEVEQILARRTRPSGIQYLVLYTNSTSDDSHWLPSSFLRSSHELQLLEDFEVERLERKALCGANDSTDDDDVLKRGNHGSDYAQAVQYDDALLAQLLAKQEALGIGSDDLRIFGGDFSFKSARDNSRNSLASYPQTSSSKRRSKASAKAFPSASAMADALDLDPYGGFDVMDTERPSLKPKRKGRRGQRPQELSDSDLNDQLQASWENDRRKKRLKKVEREELRKQGLLGRKNNSTPDLSVKYKDGFSIVDIVEEIREFWLSDLPNISLPPMEAHRRACIHQFVHNLGMSSTSRGDGSKRFTVVSKTSRTQVYDAFLFDKIASEKKYRFRFNTANSHIRKKETRTRQSVGYKDGDTVGASAPELGPENRGRAMLEKMGWRKGTALGATDNKGIMQPIAHVVKTNKAGLK